MAVRIIKKLQISKTKMTLNDISSDDFFFLSNPKPFKHMLSQKCVNQSIILGTDKQTSVKK